MIIASNLVSQLYSAINLLMKFIGLHFVVFSTAWMKDYTRFFFVFSADYCYCFDDSCFQYWDPYYHQLKLDNSYLFTNEFSLLTVN